MKAAIIYASVHHENTKKVVEAIAGENAVDLIGATKEKERDLSGYDLIGFASGVYYGKFSCKGYDTFGPFKLVGGIAKGHPNGQELADAVAFYKGIIRR